LYFKTGFSIKNHEKSAKRKTINIADTTSNPAELNPKYMNALITGICHMYIPYDISLPFKRAFDKLGIV
jgi:hypothetical protein